MEKDIVLYQPVIADIKEIISAGQQRAYSAASTAMVLTYWHVGKRIVEQEQNGGERAEYGKRLISVLSEELKKDFGKSYSERNLHYFKKFYLYFPDEQIVNACVQNLSWTHFRSLLRVSDENAASTKFWEMEKRIKRDKKNPGVLMEVNKQSMLFDLLHLLREGVITVGDLDDFSDELKEDVKFLKDRLG